MRKIFCIHKTAAVEPDAFYVFQGSTYFTDDSVTETGELSVFNTDSTVSFRGHYDVSAFVPAVVPGDIVVEVDCTEPEYIFKTDDEDSGGLGTNACRHSWIKRGLRSYGDEVYSYTQKVGDRVVDHYGDGSWADGNDWYMSQTGKH